ncbi:DUF4870 domain-containing protein [Puia sp.]|jgi:hypothetical protein|uniref:DUF4870 domain-containing protein n=1 Tax=Puia sp. TaxID=2045100 RepID=UPI002F3E26DC
MPEEYPLSTPTSDERMLAILSHVLAIVPGIGILGPLIIWLIKKDESPFVNESAKESLNFQITIIVGWIIGWLTAVVLIGLFILAAVAIANFVLVIIATIKTSENKIYRYPFNLRLIK